MQATPLLGGYCLQLLPSINAKVYSRSLATQLRTPDALFRDHWVSFEPATRELPKPRKR